MYQAPVGSGVQQPDSFPFKPYEMQVFTCAENRLRISQVRTRVMDADRDDPDDYDRSGALLAASSAPNRDKEPSKAASPAPGKQTVKSRRDPPGMQVRAYSAVGSSSAGS